MRIPGLQVLSALSTLRLQSQGDGLEWAKRHLAARYLVVGDIDLDDQTFIVNIRLRDATAQQEVLIQRVECHLSQLHDFHRGIVVRIVALILPELRQAEIERALATASSNSTAYGKLLQAIVALNRHTRDQHFQAETLLIEALEIDPYFSDAYAWYARLLSIRVGQGWAIDRTAVCNKALDLAQHAVWFDPENALALAIAGHLHSYLRKRFRQGLELLERAVTACPNEPMAWLLRGISLSYIGRAAEGRKSAETALLLSPYDPFSYMFHSFISACCYFAGDFDASVRHARLSIGDNPNYSTTYKPLTMSLVALGDLDEARRAGAKLMALEPAFAATAQDTLPIADPAERHLALRRLRAAGVVPAGH